MTEAVEQQGSGATKVVRIRRTYLVERIQEFLLEIPADYDVSEWLANDFYGLDERLNNEGKLVLNDYEHVDVDELDLKEVPVNLDDIQVVAAGTGL